MNVVHREKRGQFKNTFNTRKLLIRNDATGIRGGGSVLPLKTKNVIRPNNAPRYNFDKSDVQQMKPPLEPPRGYKRKLANDSTNSAKLHTSDAKIHSRNITANDFGQIDSSRDLFTPKHRPNAFRYVSSSSRGGNSGTHSTSITVAEASVVLAISEGRGMARGEIGIAAIDLRHPQLELCQFSDTLLYTHTLTKINYFNPVEIIVPHTFCEGIQPNQLYQLIRKNYPTINLTTVQRRHFNDAVGLLQIKTLCAPSYSAVYLQILQKFYALTAAAAVLKYVEYIQCMVFARESLKIEYHSSDNTMTIDVGTATQLELVQPLVPSAGATCCLLGVLGPTYTLSGIRTLRASILQPSYNREFIENRLDVVQELIENESGLMIRLQDIVKKLAEIDKILFLCVESPMQNIEKMGEAYLNQMLLLKTTMDLVPLLIEALETAESGKLRKMKIDFENPQYKEICDRIHSVIQDDAHLEKGAMGSLQRCFAVKPNINGLLDVARKTYSELIEDIQKIVEQLGENYDLPIRLHQNLMKGFHIVLTVSPKNRKNFNVEDLPGIFIQVQNNGATISMTTEELVVLDQQAKETLKEIQRMSNIIISSLLKDLRPFMTSLYKLCENVAEIDILLALAQASSAGSYIRPEFDNYLNIRNSVHPLLDFNTQVMPIPNDIEATPEHNFSIITGPNMGGKSIYIKQIAIIQIMAQLGCFLPATKATLRLCDRIFSRIGFNDSLELNASTYVLEMKEMQHILKALTPTSLVIIDELCRGTSAEEGTSMSWAICEELIMSDAFTFFTTHFIYLTRLEELYFNVVNLHTTVKEVDSESEDSKRLVYEHKIKVGSSKIEKYGLALAANTNLPVNTVNLAKELAELIIQNKKPQEPQTLEENDELLIYKLNAEIAKEMRKNDYSHSKITEMVNNFKRTNPKIVENLQKQKFFNENNISSIRDFTRGNVTKSSTISNAPTVQYKPLEKKPITVDATIEFDTSHDETNNTLVKPVTDLFNTIIEDDELNYTNSDSTKTNKQYEDTINQNYTNEIELQKNQVNDNESGPQALAFCEVVYDTEGEENEMSKYPSNTISQDTQNKSYETNSYITDSDKELMRETIAEINVDLENSCEDEIFTPPPEFQDVYSFIVD